MQRIIDWLSKMLAWAIWHSLRRDCDRPDLRKIIDREVSAVRQSVIAYTEFQVSEQEILTQRLGRRFDLGMALNEATSRALEAKKAAGDELKPQEQLTSKQLDALAVQEQYLQKIVNRQ